MARVRDRLSALTIQRTREPGLYCDGAGLYFRVAPGGSRGWIFRYARHGKTRDMGLGPYPDVSLARARELAAGRRQDVRDGIDPIEQRRAKVAVERVAGARATTFDECAAAYIAAHEAGWRNARHREQWTRSLAAYVSPIIGNLPVGAIDTALVLKVLEPIWRQKAETATRVRGRIELVLDYAKAREQRSGENPARWRGHLDKLLPKKSKVQPVEHMTALPYVDVPNFMEVLRKRTSIAARALEFVILTACRAGEGCGAEWNEIDLEAGIWVVPGARMKSGKEHRVPLSPAALLVLKKMGEIRTGDFVFASARQRTHVAVQTLPPLCDGHTTTHGFRSSFRDWAADRTSYPNHVVEAALAHTIR